VFRIHDDMAKNMRKKFGFMSQIPKEFSAGFEDETQRLKHD